MGSTAPPMIASLELSVFSHATEDEGKVERALLNLIPEEVAKTDLRVQELSGHYGDPLILMTAKIADRKDAGESFRSLVRSLSTLDRRRLIDEAVDRVDEAGNLYLRFDKQKAYGGKAVLHEADPIRVRCKFRIPHGADTVGVVRAFIASVLDEVEHGSETEVLRREDA